MFIYTKEAVTLVYVSLSKQQYSMSRRKQKNVKVERNNKPNVLGIYCRISKLKEDGKDRSIDDQKRLGVEKADSLGMEYKVYIDEGITATGNSISERPNLVKLIQDVESNKIRDVFILDESRLSRNVVTKIFIIDTFKEYNIVTYSSLDGILDYSDPNIEFMSELKSVIHKRTVMEQSQKIKSILRNNALKGKAQGILPYGYKKDDDGRMVVDKDEAEIVRRIYDMNLSGYGVNKIANILSDEGVQTRYNKMKDGTLTTVNNRTGIKTIRNKKDITWAGNTIRNIITNSVYRGKRHFSGVEYDCPAIFEEAYWHRVNEAHKKRNNPRGKGTDGLYLLKDLLYCGKCERYMYGRSRGAKENSYMCNSKRYPKLNCGSRAINIKRFDEFIWNEMTSNANIKDHIIKGITNTDNKAVIDKLELGVENIKKRLNSLNSEKERAVKLIIKGTLSENDFIKEKNSIENQLQTQNSQLSKIQAEISNLKSAIKNIDEIRQDFDNIVKSEFGFNQKQKILRKYISHITVQFFEPKRKGNTAKDKKWNKEQRNYHIHIFFKHLPKGIKYILDSKCKLIRVWNLFDAAINDSNWIDKEINHLTTKNKAIEELNKHMDTLPYNEDDFYDMVHKYNEEE